MGDTQRRQYGNLISLTCLFKESRLKLSPVSPRTTSCRASIKLRIATDSFSHSLSETRIPEPDSAVSINGCRLYVQVRLPVEAGIIVSPPRSDGFSDLPSLLPTDTDGSFLGVK
jgi:hypothetical protein